MEDYIQDQENRKRSKKKSGFGLGIIVGVTLTIGVYLLLIMVNVASLPSFEGALYSKQEWSQFVTKANTISAILDAYYIKDLDKEKMKDGMYYGLAAAVGDPYTNYLDKEKYSEFQEGSDGTYAGIGVSVLETQDGFLQISQVFEGSPAEKAGLQGEDKITSVNGDYVGGLESRVVIKRIKGEPGSKVTLTIFRKSETKSFDVDVTRAKIETPTVTSKMLEDKIGYIRLTGFEGVTQRQFLEHFNKLKADGMKSLVVDLRNNPGGRLDIVTGILEEFLPQGIITYTIDAQGNKEEHRTSNNIYYNEPLAVLVNGNSASASEIFTAAVKDYEVGTIVGTTTFGKGLVQTLYPLPDGSALKLTIAKYYTPKGNYIHGTGVAPDLEVQPLDEYKYRTIIPEDKDPQLDAAKDVLKKQMAK